MPTQLAFPIGPRGPVKAKRKAFYDTTRIPFPELVAAVRRAEFQDDAVLAVYRVHMVLAPSRAQQILDASGARMLITSVRRSISTLTGAGALRKLDTTVPGPYGMAEHLWELVIDAGGKVDA